MSDFTTPMLRTPTMSIRDVWCEGRHRLPGSEESTGALHIVFPYRGLYVRHLGRDRAVAEASQVLFFNPGDGYRVSHPVPGGDASLDIVMPDHVLAELTPRALVHRGATLAFRGQRRRIDEGAQRLVAVLRHRIHSGIEPLEAESLAISLVRRSLCATTSRAPEGSAVRRRLVDRTKMLLASSPARRWTLGEISTAIGHSPVYLTQLFQSVESVPLYRYHLHLRLARALHALGECSDLTSLALDLGFSSHSHFANAFRRAYGTTPTAFRRAVKPRQAAPPAPH